MQRSPSPFAVDDNFDNFRNQKRDIMGNPRQMDPLASPRNDNSGFQRNQPQQRSAFDHMNNRNNSNNFNNQRDQNDNFSSRQNRQMNSNYNNNIDDSNMIESIASKRMAVRRGRGIIKNL